VNVTPRYAKMMAPNSRDIIGWQNIGARCRRLNGRSADSRRRAELISDRPFETMLAELKRLKEEYPERVLIASIMEECTAGAWAEIIGRCEEVGVDGFEINFSCPHGMPERRMGMAMGQDPELLSEARIRPLARPALADPSRSAGGLTRPPPCPSGPK
jgi:dihydropyrimidine dehydrogenase (NADP+)